MQEILSANREQGMNREELELETMRADIEIKRSHAELLKAQTRRENAHTENMKKSNA